MEMNKERAQAMEYALIVNRLLDPAIFPDVLKSIKTDNAKLFEETCGKAGIPAEMIPCMRKVVFGQSLKAAAMW